MNDSVVLVKNGGFYSCYGDDCYIMHYLFGYSISKDKVGFPLKSYDKVVNKLKELKINFIDKSGGISISYDNLNRYEEFVCKGMKKFKLNKRIDNIIEKLVSLDENKIENIINYIEGVVNE